MAQAQKPETKPEESPGSELAVVSQRFLSNVEKQFAAEMGGKLEFSDLERVLAQHIFLKIDTTMKELEKKRTDKSKPEISWNNVNLQKLSLDAVHRVSLGLDALIKNHLHPIPYLNGKTKKYDLDLRVGYAGEDLIRRTLALDPPVDIVYQLVHATDVFMPYMKSAGNKIETYDFEIKNPFARGAVVGGFGYIVCGDPTKNKLVIVDQRDFKKAEAAAKTADFWGKEGTDEKYRDEMMFKTVVHRTCAKIPLDPAKVNSASYAYIEAQSFELEEGEMQAEIEAEANAEIIDIEPAEIEESAEGGTGQQQRLDEVAEKVEDANHIATGKAPF